MPSRSKAERKEPRDAELPPSVQNGTADPGARSRAQFDVEEDGERLDRFLAQRVGEISRSRIQTLIRSGCARDGSGKLVDPGHRVKRGDRISIDIPPPEPAEPAPEDIALTVVYEDDQLIVVDKPAGLVVHPAAGHTTGTLVNALIAHCGASLSGIGGVKRPGIVHRLDKDTSGLLVVAKTDAAHRALAAQFAEHGADGRLERSYLALAWGVPERPAGRIDAPLERSSSNRTKIAVARGTSANPSGGRWAVTHFEVLETFADSEGRPVASLVRCRLETGRTHQIRVHLAHIGHPILGDSVYGSHFAASARRLTVEGRAALEALGRQALHAAELGFVHPRTERQLSFSSSLPPDLERLVKALRKAPETSTRRKTGRASVKR